MGHLYHGYVSHNQRVGFLTFNVSIFWVLLGLCLAHLSLCIAISEAWAS